MNSAVCSRLNLPFVALLLTTTLLTHPATAQDPAAQAAQQAAMAAQQAAQQANDQAMQAAQQASQQAMQAAQAAATDNTPSYSTSNRQQAPAIPSPNTPVPLQIRSAHTIFLANDGSDPNFPIDPNTAYSAFYDALQAWGHYQLAPSAQQADLVFQLHGVAPITDISGGRGGVYSSTSPAFQLTIRDPKTNTRLWTVTSPFIVTPRRSKLDYWQQVSMTNLVSRLKVLAGQPLSPVETADLTTVPNYHTGRAALIIVGATVGAGVAGGLLLHHEFENSLANMKASQDAFCTANNIPLSECAGG
jgi:hypothetical protein